MATTTTAPVNATGWDGDIELRKRKVSPGRVALYVFLTIMALMWLFPMLWAVYNSLRDYGYTLEHGYVSFGGFTLQNFPNAWRRGGFATSFGNSAVITIAAVVFTLAASSCMAFVLARVKFRFNFAMLAVFVAANLLTHPLLWFVAADRLHDRLGIGGLLLAEAGVVAVEAAVYARWLRPRPGRWLAGWLALLANALSVAVGIVVH